MSFKRGDLICFNQEELFDDWCYVVKRRSDGVYFISIKEEVRITDFDVDAYVVVDVVNQQSFMCVDGQMQMSFTIEELPAVILYCLRTETTFLLKSRLKSHCICKASIDEVQ